MQTDPRYSATLQTVLTVISKAFSNLDDFGAISAKSLTAPARRSAVQIWPQCPGRSSDIGQVAPPVTDGVDRDCFKTLYQYAGISPEVDLHNQSCPSCPPQLGQIHKNATAADV